MTSQNDSRTPRPIRMMIDDEETEVRIFRTLTRWTVSAVEAGADLKVLRGTRWSRALSDPALRRRISVRNIRRPAETAETEQRETRERSVPAESRYWSNNALVSGSEEKRKQEREQ